MGNLGFPELAVIAVVALLLVGPKRLPELAKACGEAVRAFQNALKGQTHDEPDSSDRHDQA